MTNYFVARVKQDVLGTSEVGATMTAMNSDGFAPAYVGSVDSNLRWNGNAYRFFTRLATSRTGTIDNREKGYEAIVHFSKSSGWFGGQVYVDARSPEFDVNDVGFMNRANHIQTGLHLYLRRNHPWALARQSTAHFITWSHWNYDRVNLAKGVDINVWNDLKNYWGVRFGARRHFQTLDDLMTRGGPLMVKPALTEVWLGFGTDSRKPIHFDITVAFDRSDKGPSLGRRFRIRTKLRPASNIQIQMGLFYRQNLFFAQWITNVDDQGDGRDDHYVFGELDSQLLDFTVRSTIGFTPQLSLQFYLQPFVAIGDYTNFKDLSRPSSYAFTPFSNLDFNPDFSRRSLRSNMVLRWEYLPGSAFFFVWSQELSTSLELDDPEFHPLGDFAQSVTDEGESIFPRSPSGSSPCTRQQVITRFAAKYGIL